MNSTLKKLYQKLAFYLCNPFQASFHTAFNVFLGVFQPVPMGVKLCQTGTIGKFRSLSHYPSSKY
jgi:hypothetical protein